MKLIKLLKNSSKTFIEQRPYLWNMTWNFIQKSKLFLPHDPTYKALIYLKKNTEGLILDIGANTGISALSFRKILPNYKIISFEPNILLEASLEKVERSDLFSYQMVGLGETDGVFKLYTPIYKNIPLHTFSALSHEDVIKALEITYKANILKDIKVNASDCEIRILDSFNLDPDIIKVDAEGNELKIFLGAIQTIKKNKPSIIFEACHGDFEEIYKFLINLNYQIFYFVSDQDIFINFSIENRVRYNSGNRNLIAISRDSQSINSLPILY